MPKPVTWPNMYFFQSMPLFVWQYVNEINKTVEEYICCQISTKTITQKRVHAPEQLSVIYLKAQSCKTILNKVFIFPLHLFVFYLVVSKIIQINLPAPFSIFLFARYLLYKRSQRCWVSDQKGHHFTLAELLPSETDNLLL